MHNHAMNHSDQYPTGPVIQYKMVGSGQTRSLVVLLDGGLETIGGAHLNFDQIADYLSSGGCDAAHVRSLLNVPGYLADRFQALSERVAFDGQQIVFDGDTIDTALSRHIIRLLREGADVRPAVNFLEKLATNPSRLSKIHLWAWLRDRDFTITPNGNVIGYKAVRNTPDNLSITAGNNRVRVNGVAHTGHIPNPLGAVVAIPRSVVDPARDHGCSVGLHVGTWDYARDFTRMVAGKVLTVAVNPRDVVAVPRDFEHAKMRVCQYTVIDVTPIPHDTALLTLTTDEDERVDGREDDDWEECGPHADIAFA